MATNPMQRRARNSFLIGILVTTLILGMVIAFLVVSMMNMKNTQDELQAAKVFIINKDIESGDNVTTADLTEIRVSKSVAPTNAASPATITEAQNRKSSEENDENSKGQNIVAKIKLLKGTIVTSEMLGLEDAQGDDVRKQEYNTVVLPTDLTSGDYVDIRFLLPSGQDFVVVSKKKIEIPLIAGVYSTDTISMELSEDEILSMSNAIVETYMINGSKLYATKYTDAGNQEAAKITYPVNGEVAKLVENDSNILPQALQALRARYNRDIRENYINSTISAQQDATENEKTKMQESITNSQTSREQYLQSLGGGTSTTN